MPKIRRHRLSEALVDHLLLRVRQRGINFEQVTLFSRWLDTDPIVPSGRWFKRFGAFTVCGEGELVKTFLTAGQLPDGEEIP
jgi:hypothetical protein